jgi:hypothetical protein
MLAKRNEGERIMSKATSYHLLLAVFVLLVLNMSTASAQTTEFTYQGRLVDGSMPANASYDFEFNLFDVETGGTKIGTQTRLGVPVANGIFTVRLDFGAEGFRGSPRFLEIFVKPAGGPTFTALTPRQPVTSAPHAIKSLHSDTAQSAFSATEATNSAQLGGIAANQYVITTDSRMTDARNPLPNSGNYVQNTTTQQATSNFNIAGNGTAGGTLSGNAVNAATQYNIGANRVLTVTGAANTFAGIGAGTSSTGDSNSFFGRNAGGGLTNSGSSNSFFGERAGVSNTTGFGNTFFGSTAGLSNTTGRTNAFLGVQAGQSNTTGFDNSYFGVQAGFTNTTGNNNAIFGRGAGVVNTASNNSFFGTEAGAANTSIGSNTFFGYRSGFANTAGGNSFFGYLAGSSTTTGPLNSFFGNNAGGSNTTGNSNSFFGYFAGQSNTTGSNITLLGENADVGVGNLSNATAIGANAQVTQSNSLVLGNGVNVGIGTTSPDFKLHVVGGSDAEPGSGGFIVTGLRNSTNVVIDNNEIMARNNGATATLAINAAGGNVNLIQGGTGNVGIGTSSPTAKLDVIGAARATSLEVNGGAIRVIGAGVGTNTAAFIQAANVCGLTYVVCIDHPLANNRPDALLFVTPIGLADGPFYTPTGGCNVIYAGQGWRIVCENDINAGWKFNVLIILP